MAEQDLAERVTVARRRVDEASRQQARAEAEAAAAEREAERALARLSEEFGVESVEAAEELQAELERTVRVELERVEQQLSEAGEESV